MTRHSRHLQALRDLQRWFAARILDPALLAAAENDLVLRVPEGADAVERMRVHTDGYPARVTDALAESFPAVVHLVGERRARDLAKRYLAAPLPRSYNLNVVGARFPDFLEGDPLTADLPFLPDLARLEWRVARAFHAKQQQPLRRARIAALGTEDWSRARLRFQRGVAVVRSGWPIADLRAARDTPVDAIDIDLRNRPQNVLVRRSGFEVACDLVDDGEATALSHLLSRQPLVFVMQRLGEAGYEPDAVRAWFARWMSLGLIVGYSTYETIALGRFAFRSWRRVSRGIVRRTARCWTTLRALEQMRFVRRGNLLFAPRNSRFRPTPRPCFS